MATDPSAQVCWIFANEDESIARELLSRASVLQAQGLVSNFEMAAEVFDTHAPASSAAVVSYVLVPGVGPVREHMATTAILGRADVVVFLCSHALFDGVGWKQAFSIASRNRRTRIIPVIVSASELPAELATFQVLPRDGQPILARPNRDEGLLEVIQGLLETVSFRQRASRPLRSPRLGDAAGGGSFVYADGEVAISSPTPSGAYLGVSINEIFRLDGVPSFTFIEPPQFARLQLELRTMGTGLIVEGPSKVGKSTAIRKAMEALSVAPGDQIWWHGQRPPPLAEVSRILDELLRATRDTWLFIDDFHHLEDERYQRELASAMKVLADLPTRHAKITLIGINPLGNSLVQVMPDLGGRFRVVRLDIEKDWAQSNKIAELIIRGESAANVRFSRRDEFVVAAAGSFYLAQYLCNTAAEKSGIRHVQPELVDIELGPTDVLAAIQGELSARFRAPMIDFAAFDESPPPRGAGLSLLWLLARSSDGFVPVREARLRFPVLNTAFDWLLASNLTRCFRAHPQLQRLLYYNRATQTLTMEDPQLKFYLRALDWEEFAAASGHGQVRFHSEDGPLWPITGSAVGGISGRGTAVVGAEAVSTSPAASAPRRLLHLSDLHFSTQDQATVWYAQLAADLREQRVEQLDGLIVSGDLVNRADPAEYDAARLFLERLMSSFALTARHVALVPGNHDVSWSVAEEAYTPHRRKRYAGSLVSGHYIERDGGLIEVRDEAAYRKRFQQFSGLYRAIKGVEYPLAYEDQGILDDLGDLGICILGLNSAWEIDHHFRDRASIHAEALANALIKLGGPVAGQLRIAVFHHPMHGGEDSRIRDASFLQQLAVHGFQLALHGHVHKADAELYRHDRTEGGRRIEIVAAGTFGAPTREWVPGYPLEYNLLLVDADKITVETRCRREINGAWAPDARWLQGPGKDPLPRYVVER